MSVKKDDGKIVLRLKFKERIYARGGYVTEDSVVTNNFDANKLSAEDIAKISDSLNSGNNLSKIQETYFPLNNNFYKIGLGKKLDKERESDEYKEYVKKADEEALKDLNKLPWKKDDKNLNGVDFYHTSVGNRLLMKRDDYKNKRVEWFIYDKNDPNSGGSYVNPRELNNYLKLNSKDNSSSNKKESNSFKS